MANGRPKAPGGAVDEIKKLERLYLAEMEAALKLGKDMIDAVPTTWLDNLLTGPKSVGSLPMDGKQVESLLNQIKGRLQRIYNEYDKPALGKSDG